MQDSNGRLYYRFAVPKEGFATVTFKTIKPMTLPVTELSYGGFGVDLSGIDSHNLQKYASDEGVFKVTLNLLSESCELLADLKYIGGGRAGFCFLHESSKTVNFLRVPLLFSRWGFAQGWLSVNYGAGLEDLPKSLNLDAEIPVQARFQFQDSELVLMKLTFVENNISYEVRFEQAEVITSHDILPGAYLDALRPTQEFDVDLLKRCLWFVAGFAEGTGDTSIFEPCLRGLLRAFREQNGSIVDFPLILKISS